jgi:cytoskeletal protein RodZ
MRPKDDKGQVLSSLVAVLAVVAIVAGLLVLFGTRGHDSAASDDKATGTDTPKPSVTPSTVAASVPKPSAQSSSTAPDSPTPSSEPTTEPPEAAQPTTIPPDQRPAVEVYNNTSRKGLADSVAGRARQAGWVVAGADNWHGKIVSSTVYYPAGMQVAAAQLARDLAIGRTKDALDNMKKDRLTVILTTDYAG